MHHNGREIYNSKVTTYLVNKNSSECMYDFVGERKARIKENIKNSNKYITHQNARNVAQEFTKRKSEVVGKLHTITEQTYKDVLKAIATDLCITTKSKKANQYMQTDISFEQIEDVFNVYLPVLKKLKAICYNEEIESVNQNFHFCYKKFFDALIELDIRFALFAPKSSLNKAGVDLKIEILPIEYKNQINQLKETLEVDEDLDYVSTKEVEQIKTTENSKRQDMIDSVNEVEFKSKFEMVKATETLSSNLFKFIIKELDLQDFDEVIKAKDVGNVLNVCAIGLSALKNSSESEELNEIAGWENFDPYTELFNRLIDINIKFAFFAPKSSLNRFDIDFKKMHEKEREVMLTILKKHGLWDDPEYVEVYQPLFSSATNLNV